MKTPYSNAGQGIFPITNAPDLDQFLRHATQYDLFVVQELIGENESTGQLDDLAHVGTLPSGDGHIYASDLRMMVISTKSGFHPIALYGRRAKRPLGASSSSGGSSWDRLGTNLSRRAGDQWTTDVDRLIPADDRFDQLGLGIDALIAAYVQTVLATIAIDRLAYDLTNERGQLRKRWFQRLGPDQRLIREIMG